ncbi:MAG TPA: histidine phosphatase family protein [Nocardioidaceae bacterium]|nr:histidine phosphatase family protein [Nocardioidaceae bacterium]
MTPANEDHAADRGALLVVRHAMPLVSPTTPPNTWHLSAEGRAAARALRHTLPRDARLFSSSEPKAWQTLGGSTQVARDDRFNEVSRPAEPWDGDYKELRRRYVASATQPGWEPPADAASRFQAGVSAATSGQHATDVPTVIATHGMVLTVWLVSIGAVPRQSAARFWSDLRFPDCLLVDLASRRVRTYHL